MKLIKTYSQYRESLNIDLRYHAIDLMESLNIWHDALLSAIAAKEEDIYDVFSLPKEFSGKLNLDFLEDSVEFINSFVTTHKKLNCDIKSPNVCLKITYDGKIESTKLLDTDPSYNIDGKTTEFKHNAG